ncbi:MAG TPA: class I SAM-dependent methyltransferase [Chloroflexia bacterium]|nr:class I SAM-dependent methyltransferase [Chloroflexia bacterium]
MLQTTQAEENIAPSDAPDLEERLAAAIEPWLGHMKWRKDFEAWRERRIWQEKHQGENVKDVRRAVMQVAGKILLDLGAGMGGLSVALMRELCPEGLRLHAMDYNPDYCRIASLRAERYGLSLPILVAAGESLPYGDEAFDIVVCLDVLEHVADAERVLSEIYRVLKPGGVALTTVPNRHAFRDPHYHLPLINWLPRWLAEKIVEARGRSKRGGMLHDRQGLSELNTYSWGGFKRLASGLGFRVRDQVYARITKGEIRQLHGWRRRLLGVAGRLGILSPLYRLYRHGWQGTYQIMLVKPW